MTDTPTPGQVNYEAYCAVAPDVDPALPFVAWDELPPGDRHAWEAAAQAVLAWQAAQSEEAPPG